MAVFESFISVISSLDSEALRVVPERCVQVRHKGAKCLRCAEVCAAGAIAYDGEDVTIDGDLCIGCGSCATACPTGALGPEGFQPAKCLSALTQEKGALPSEVVEQIKHSPTVWGCDLCQQACPFNHCAALSPLPEFRENLLPSLTLEELEGLSNRAFRRKYGDRAFAWRGIGPLVRNLGWREEGE